jgi:RNA polymerase sigma-70 factor (ECF subfamily)
LHLERYREYLRFLAQMRLSPCLRKEMEPSDVAQETLMRAHENRDQFRGPTEALPGWLRAILKNYLAEVARKYARRKRDRALEQSLEAALEQSSIGLEKWLADQQSSPSERAARQEQLVQMADALAGLPPDERTALELRYLQEPPWPLADIALRLGRPSSKAVSGLLERGLRRLRELLPR